MKDHQQQQHFVTIHQMPLNSVYFLRSYIDFLYLEVYQQAKDEVRYLTTKWGVEKNETMM
jgi:hypothetical protein